MLQPQGRKTLYKLCDNRLQREMRKFQAVKQRKRLQMLKRSQENVDDFDNEEEEEEAVAEG